MYVTSCERHRESPNGTGSKWVCLKCKLSDITDQWEDQESGWKAQSKRLGSVEKTLKKLTKNNENEVINLWKDWQRKRRGHVSVTSKA